MLLCICRQELVESLRRSVLGYPDWVMLALEIVEGDRAFYRKVAGAVHPDFIPGAGKPGPLAPVPGVSAGSALSPPGA